MKARNEHSAGDVGRQLWKYLKTTVQADMAWIVSYQALYYGIAYGIGVSAPQSAFFAHLISIGIVDGTRPILLMINRTLKSDQARSKEHDSGPTHVK